MSFTVFLGNLPTWVAKDDIKSWLASENLVFDDIKVIRNPETQESKGFAFIETPNEDEMKSIIRRFDRAPLEDRLLRANQAQPPKSAVGKPPTKSPAPSDRNRRPASPPAGPPAASTAVTSAAVTNAAVTNAVITSAPNSAPAASSTAIAPPNGQVRKTGTNSNRRTTNGQGRQSAFAEELAKAL